MAMFDCDFDTRDILDALRQRAEAENYRFYIGRYIASRSSWKTIPNAEWIALANFHTEMQNRGGFCKTWLIFEDGGRPRSAAEGANNAVATRREISRLNVPLGGLICYTSDEDGPTAPVLAATRAYYDGLRDHNTGQLIVTPGLYASGAVAEAAYEAGIIKVRWPTMSSGFRGTREAIQKGEYEFRQGLEVHYAGKVVDPDVFREGADIEHMGFFPASVHVGAQGLAA